MQTRRKWMKRVRDRCRSSANTEDFVHSESHLVLSGKMMQAVSPTSFEPLLGFSCR